MSNPKGTVKNLKRFGKEIPPPSREQAAKAGSKGGKTRAANQAERMSSKAIVEMIDELPVNGSNAELLEDYGIPLDLQTQRTLRLIGLQKRAASGDPAANELLLKIRGEAPSTTVNVDVNESAREAYEKAAAAIKSK